MTGKDDKIEIDGVLRHEAEEWLEDFIDELGKYDKVAIAIALAHRDIQSHNATIEKCKETVKRDRKNIESFKDRDTDTEYWNGYFDGIGYFSASLLGLFERKKVNE